MTNIASATTTGPRARLMYDAVVAGYINDISERRRRPVPAAKPQRAEHRRALARETVGGGAWPGRTARPLAITASC